MNEQAEESKRHPKHVEVHVQDIKEAEKVTFSESITATLAQVWDKSYVELKIARRAKDVFQTAGHHPKSLMGDLGLTLEQARDQGVITDYRFSIASETGGA
ncbi:MAG TPA: hypothetical protein VJ727_07580 [Rhodanobacteraceae bacterium]|nr:hypothetical protein [Rhodanobacteraceae bacterium]